VPVWVNDNVDMSDVPQPYDASSVTGPPDGVPPAPPVITRLQTLPFGELTWQNFERVCHRLLSLNDVVEHCQRYGKSGEAQEGIDVYARQKHGRYHCLQAKRHRTFNVLKIRQAVDLFLAGTWACRAERFTIAVQSSLGSTDIQEEIERQTERLKARGIVFFTWDGETLTKTLRTHPELIDDFFGRPWVQALLGDEAAAGLGGRLDGADFAKVRTQLNRVYESQFHSVDPGSFGSVGDAHGRPELTLLERFLKPDMLVREAAGSLETVGRNSIDLRGEDIPRTSSRPSERTEVSPSTAARRIRRMQLNEWIGDAHGLVVIGDAGSGKSTLLRVIALDLMRDQVHFPELTARWGRHLPVYVPFARWTALTARAGNAVGIKQVVRSSLDPLLTGSLADLLDKAIDDRRVLLLIDGLDEWSNEQAARTTLNSLRNMVEVHDMPIVVSGRPRGLEKIGTLPSTWRRGTVAPLSTIQQSSIASRWFSRFSSQQVVAGANLTASLRTDRFMAELARDANLATLASTPLLLVGLVTLALRGQNLPRTRSEIYDQLVRVLLDVHPSNRATAAGDTEPRFRYSNDQALLRGAIAYLAFALREQSGGGMPVASARDALKKFLALPIGFALSGVDAARVANDILCVNSETQGLIVEKGPSEVGFVHASFEEYLGAEHINGWTFEAIAEFVGSHAGDVRWRNVIANLLCRQGRRDEVDRLVARIEEPSVDELSQINRQALLGDVAFGLSTNAAFTAKRLAIATMDRVETEDWLPARREALGSVLKGLSDPSLRIEVEKRLNRWLPCRELWPASLIETLGLWQPTPQLQDILFSAMHSEDRVAQRASAKAYAKLFAPEVSASERLVETLTRSRDLNSAAAMLECLALGWPTLPVAISLFQQAWGSHRGALRLAGALGLAAGGLRLTEMRDSLLRAQNFWSLLAVPHRSLATEMLITYWPDDPDLVKGAVDRLVGYSQSPWEHDSAHAYLLSCDIKSPQLRGWVIRELSGDNPFGWNSSASDVWDQVGQLAVIDSEVRFAANKYWLHPQRRLLGFHRIAGYVTNVADSEIAKVLLDELANGKHGFNRLDAFEALLAGWGRNDPAVSLTLEEVLARPDEEVEELLSLLPELYADKALARDRLLRMGHSPSVRRDLLTQGLAQCGCDGSDNEAVQSIVSQMGRTGSIYSFTQKLYQSFGTHPAVRAMAAQSLRTRNTAPTEIAAGYPNDPEFAQQILDAAVPLSAELRTQIIEFAVDGASGTALETVLGLATLESDPELQARMVRAQHQRLSADAREHAKKELIERAVAVGAGYDSVRASALAGLTAIGALDALVNLQDRGKPVRLSTGESWRSAPSLERQICEQFADFESVFGAGLSDRFSTPGQPTRLAEILATAPSASAAARAAFLKIAERGELPRTVLAIRALASECPRSALLLQHCWAVIESDERNNASATLNGEIAVVLREHFANDVEVQRQLVARYKKSPCATTAITLAVYAPQLVELPSQMDQAVNNDFGKWAIAIHLSAYRADSNVFVELLETMVTREFRSPFDAQEIANLAIEERLHRDPELVALLSARLHSDVDRSVSGSFARYLASTGKLDNSGRGRVEELLRFVAAAQSLPLAGYDAKEDEWRATRATLLDALSAGLELS
jgi:NACHT domain